MSIEPDLASVARTIVDANRYLTLATADRDGDPWPSPVWYAHDRYTEFLWVSRPDARHSRNLAERPQVGIVIFDSTAAPGSAQAVYVRAVAGQLGGAECERAIGVYSARSQALGIAEWTIGDVSAPAPHRLYRATASEIFVLGANDRRVPVAPGLGKAE